jgi:hypothetical protein
LAVIPSLPRSIPIQTTLDDTEPKPQAPQTIQLKRRYCEECGKDISSKKSDARFCSEGCYDNQCCAKVVVLGVNTSQSEEEERMNPTIQCGNFLKRILSRQGTCKRKAWYEDMYTCYCSCMHRLSAASNTYDDEM